MNEFKSQHQRRSDISKEKVSVRFTDHLLILATESSKKSYQLFFGVTRPSKFSVIDISKVLAMPNAVLLLSVMSVRSRLSLASFCSKMGLLRSSFMLVSLLKEET